MATIQKIGGKPAAPTAPGQSLAWTAQHLAAVQTKQAEDAIRAQQAQQLADAQARAALIGRASTAAAGFLKPLGDLTQADYAQALQQNTGLAQGYSGQLRQDTADAAARAQAQLASIHGNTQQAVDRGDSLANLLYGLQGSLPGQALITEGLGQTAAARALPASVLASGLNEQYGALGAGRQAAARFDPQLAAVQAKEPGLAHSILGDLISQQQKQATILEQARYHQQQVAIAAAKAKADAAYRDSYLAHLQAGDTERVAHDRANEAAGLAAAQSLADYRAGELQLGQANAQTARINARTSRINALKPPASAGPKVGAPPAGFRYNPATNQYEKVPGLPASVTKKGGQKPLTVYERTKFAKSAQQIATNARNGGTDAKGTYHPPVGVAEALREMRLEGLFADPRTAKIALRALRDAYGDTEAAIAVGAVAGPPAPPARGQ